MYHLSESDLRRLFAEAGCVVPSGSLHLALNKELDVLDAPTVQVSTNHLPSWVVVRGTAEAHVRVAIYALPVLAERVEAKVELKLNGRMVFVSVKPLTNPNFNVQIAGEVKGLMVGDGANVTMTFGGKGEPKIEATPGLFLHIEAPMKSAVDAYDVFRLKTLEIVGKVENTSF